MDDLQYELYKEETFSRFENVCRRCGECCGSRDGDPCRRLAVDEETGYYYCSVYDNRFGPQETVSGKVFTCVPIRQIMKMGHLRQNCAYNR